MNTEELNEVLRLHKLWLENKADGKRADLRGADLSGADLSGADLRGANLRGANLSRAKGVDNIRDICSILPDGELIGWKKLADGTICKLKIPAEARRSNSTGRKCRAEYADILQGEGVSSYDSSIVYKVGKRVHCDKWNEDWTIECGGGIHFFITRHEAEEYIL